MSRHSMRYVIFSFNSLLKLFYYNISNIIPNSISCWTFFSSDALFSIFLNFTFIFAFVFPAVISLHYTSWYTYYCAIEIMSLSPPVLVYMIEDIYSRTSLNLKDYTREVTAALYWNKLDKPTSIERKYTQTLFEF